MGLSIGGVRWGILQVSYTKPVDMLSTLGYVS